MNATRPTLFVLSAGVLLMPACVAENARTTTGPGVLLPMFTERTPADATQRPHDTPSATTLSREHWTVTDVVASPDGLRTRPTYADNRTSIRHTARQRGDPPSPRSALELSDTTQRQFYSESFWAPVNALGDLVMMPWHMYKQSPWGTTVVNPMLSYWRAPARDVSLEMSPSQRLNVETDSNSAQAPSAEPVWPQHAPDADE